MDKQEVSIINSLFRSDWNPEKGDFVKENSIKDGEVLRDQLKKHRTTVWFLWSMIIAIFVIAMVILSI